MEGTRHATYIGPDERLRGEGVIVKYAIHKVDEEGNFLRVNNPFLVQFDRLDLFVDGVHLGFTWTEFKPEDFVLDPEEHEYLFDVDLRASIRVSATSREKAECLLKQALDCASCNAGAWPNGDPILFEASVNGVMELVEIDGEFL